jgi:hypothetical protein
MFGTNFCDVLFLHENVDLPLPYHECSCHYSAFFKEFSLEGEGRKNGKCG